jgi:hypothetical protein
MNRNQAVEPAEIGCVERKNMTQAMHIHHYGEPRIVNLHASHALLHHNFAPFAVYGVALRGAGSLYPRIEALPWDFCVDFLASHGDFALRRKRGRKARNTLPLLGWKRKSVTQLKIAPIALGAPVALLLISPL